MAFALIPLLYKGAALGAAAYGSNKLLRKGEALIEEGGGLGGIGEQVTDAVARLDVFDIFGLNRQKAAKEQAQHDAERREDKRASEKKLKKAQKEQQKKLDALQRKQRDELSKLNREDDAEDAAMRADFDRRMAEQKADFDRRLAEMATANASELRAVKDANRRAQLLAARRNILATRAAAKKAEAPDASSVVKELMQAVQGLVLQQGTVPEASIYQEQGMDLESMLSDRSAVQSGGLEFLW